MVALPFRTVAEQHIMAGNKWQVKLLTSWWPGSRETAKGRGPNIPFDGISPMT
jgi:hypothetical protein